MIYCDTSFLLALYLERDFFHVQATQMAHGIKDPIPYTFLLELELQNGVRRCLGTREISVTEHDSIFRQIADDESHGILTRHSLSQAEHYAKARDLSKRHTAQVLARSLDVLQVAAALLLKASALASFDNRQRRLAVAAGLQVIPRQLIKSREPA